MAHVTPSKKKRLEKRGRPRIKCHGPVRVQNTNDDDDDDDYKYRLPLEVFDVIILNKRNA